MYNYTQVKVEQIVLLFNFNKKIKNIINVHKNSCIITIILRKYYFFVKWYMIIEKKIVKVYNKFEYITNYVQKRKENR